MTYKFQSLFRSKHGFFRSSMASGIAGLFAGGSVIAGAVDVGGQPSVVVAAMSTIASAMIVAFADWIVRRRQIQLHETKFQNEHEKTRSMINDRLPRKRRINPRAERLPGNLEGKEEK